MTEKSKTAKTAISLPQELLDELRQREQAHDIPSVSGHIQSLLQREREAADVEATLQRLFGQQQPAAEHQAWAEKALGITSTQENAA
ncbi:metal-responsive CopG/Arc/MetJ family transcriptional regulator [Kitasatospora sp. MAA19]|uniref:hypothetical protein n=1 Tax=unclassified Kitasatospora TaxID=2633591 RepID=UPI0024749623|nr:hypothetical protein [Kitasatospora sp. MAA19]MDH6711217.1 metal-responsive CopG/Arc/MetJ family transcriptional regulator [Kitasatospora sp. MAA19]